MGQGVKFPTKRVNKVTDMSKKGYREIDTGRADLTNREISPESTTRRSFLVQCGIALSGITVVGTAAPLLSGCDTSLEPRDPSQNPGGSGGNNGGNDGLVFDVSGLNDAE